MAQYRIVMRRAATLCGQALEPGDEIGTVTLREGIDLNTLVAAIGNDFAREEVIPAEAKPVNPLKRFVGGVKKTVSDGKSI